MTREPTGDWYYTLDPGRCHQKTHHQCVPGHIPEKHETFTFDNEALQGHAFQKKESHLSW